MPGRIYEAIESFQAQILRNERRAASELVRAYGNAWARIKIELELLMSEYEKAKVMGERPSASWLFRFNRARALRDQVFRELLAFARQAEAKVREGQIEAI